MTPAEIKALRERFGLTQAELAQKLDVALSTVSRWESGQRKPHRRTIKDLRRLERKGK